MLKKILLAAMFVFSRQGFTGNQLFEAQNGQLRESPIESDFQLTVAFSPLGTAAASWRRGGDQIVGSRTGKPILVIPNRTQECVGHSRFLPTARLWP